ncbi:hypothetical protein GCM10027059_50560 [Myceligenerans halotolerans]
MSAAAGPLEPVRHPAGAPNSTGGRYASVTRLDADVDLEPVTDAEYNADATFEYPPIPRSFEQHVRFWATVPVPDAVIARVRIAYAARWPQWAQERTTAWEQENPEPVGPRLIGAANARREREQWRARHEAFTRALESERPRDLAPLVARTVIRATQMTYYAHHLPDPADRARVARLRMSLGPGRRWTVRQICETYRLDDLPAVAFEDPGTVAGLNQIAQADLLERLVEHTEPRPDDG